MADRHKSSTSPFKPAAEEPVLNRAVPVSKRLSGYRGGAAKRDLLAGLTVAALALPAGMAYAEVAGLSPVHGLYAALLPGVAYALLGSSRQVIIGPEGSLAALMAAAILPLAAAGSPDAAVLGAMLAVMTGALFLFARVARLGWIADYLSRPVLIGYIHGVVVVLIVGQLGKLLGLDLTAVDPIPQLAEIVQELGDTSLLTLAISIVAIAVLLLVRSARPTFPAALLVVVVGISASSLLTLSSHGVAVVGSVPAGLPDLSVPSVSFDDMTLLAPAAIGLFLVALADGLLTARAFAGSKGESVDASQEILALGTANIAAGMSQGMVVGASGSRTAVNDTLGARSQVAGLIAAAAIAVVLLVLTGPIADLPKAVLGAVIVAAALSLVDLSAWRELAASDHVELAMAAVTTVLVVVTGVLEAIAFAVGLSVIDVVRRSAKPHDAVLGWSTELGRYGDVSLNRDATVTPGVVVYRLDDRLFFANADYVKGRIREAIRGAKSDTHALVLDAEGLTDVDTTGMDALSEISSALEKDEIAFLLARVKTPMQARLNEAGFEEDQFHPTVRAAVAAISSNLVDDSEPARA